MEMLSWIKVGSMITSLFVTQLNTLSTFGFLARIADRKKMNFSWQERERCLDEIHLSGFMYKK